MSPSHQLQSWEALVTWGAAGKAWEPILKISSLDLSSHAHTGPQHPWQGHYTVVKSPVDTGLPASSTQKYFAHRTSTVELLTLLPWGSAGHTQTHPF
eukprot:1161704-Pelagomonas_calceolata.AAC.9